MPALLGHPFASSISFALLVLRQTLSTMGEEIYVSDEKYLDKVVEITGRIEDISTNTEGRTMVVLAAEGAMIGGVSGTLSPGFTDALASYKSGSEITLKCRCTGRLMDVVLVDCSIPGK